MGYCVRLRPERANHVWSSNFVSAVTHDDVALVDADRRIRAECLAIESEQKLKGGDVVLVLNRIKMQRGAPKMPCCDNCSEFSSQAMDLWASQHGVHIAFSRPGKPTDNALWNRRRTK